MSLRPLQAILWKNYLLKVTHFWSTLAELVLPVCFMGLLILIKSITSVSDSPNVAYYCGQSYPWYYAEDASGAVDLAQCAMQPPECHAHNYYRHSFQPILDDPNITLYEQLGYIDSAYSEFASNNPFYTFEVADESLVYDAYPLYLINPSLPFKTIVQAIYFNNAIMAVAPKDAQDGATALQGIVDDLANHFRVVAGSPYDLNIVQFDSQEALDNYITDKDYDDVGYGQGKVAFGVVVNSADVDSSSWDYSIRANYTDPFSQEMPTVACLYDMFGGCELTYSIPTTKYYTQDLLKPQSSEYLFGYSYSGFLSIQQEVDTYILSMHSTAGDVTLRISESLMPTSEFKTDDFQFVIASTLGLFYMLSYLFPVSRMVRALVLEKENRFKEGMKMMGLTDFSYNLSWLITLTIQMTVVSILITAVTGSSVFEYSNKLYVFLYFEIFSLAVMNMCFLMATVFSRSKTASLLGPLIFFASFFPYYAVSDPSFSTSAKASVCLLAPACFAIGANVFADFEGGMVGVQADNLGQTTSNFSYNLTVGMLVADIFIYGVLAWYMDKIMPSEHGTQLPWYFPFTSSYWFGIKFQDLKFGFPAGDALYSPLLEDEGEEEEEEEEEEEVEDGLEGVEDIKIRSIKSVSTKRRVPALPIARGSHGSTTRESLSANMKQNNINYEPVAPALRQLGRENRAVKLRGLRKVFKTTAEDRVAVDSLNLDFYEGQVTVLLGHNGAGKSTTIGMLVGLIPPSSGEGYLYDYKLSEDLHNIRKTLGVCPQHDILFPELTVTQHLQMYAAFKGVPSHQVDAAVARMIAEVGLNEKSHAASATLSGGQKRKLSLGIALIGDSKVVVLDEPTSGMDPYSRRSTWNIIQQNKKGRIILLTTHFMDEADILGDRIAIMADGKLRCVGSSLFLKQQYGVGYTFTVVKDAKALSQLSADRQRDLADRLKAVLTKYVAQNEVLSDVGAEVAFRLPFEAAAQFVAMFRELDDQKQELFISQYGISVTTLEEVFLKVAEHTDEEITTRASLGGGDGVGRRNLAVLNEKARAGAGAVETIEAGRGVSFDVDSVVVRQPEAKEAEKAAGYMAVSVDAGVEDDDVHSRAVEKDRREKDRLAGVRVRSPPEYASIEDDAPLVVFAKHFRALLTKRVIYGKRDKQMFVCQLVLPVLLVTFGLGILLLIPNLTQPDLTLNAAKFNPGYAASEANYVPFFAAPDSVGEALMERFNGVSDVAASPDGGVWGQAVPVDQTVADQFYNCSMGAQPLLQMSNFLVGEPEEARGNEKGSSRYGAITVSEESTLTDLAYNVMVNGSAMHGAGIFVNLVDQALLQLVSGNNKATITTHNFPLARTFNQERMSASQSAVTASFFFMIAFSFIPASFATFVVKEREIKAKHQQIISGVSLYAYWCSTWAWDCLSYCLTYLLVLAVLFAYSLDAFTKGEAGVATCIVFALYGPAIASFTYLQSYLFKSHSTAQIMVMFFNFVTGLCLMVVAFILPAIPSSQGIAPSLRYLFRLFPSFCLGDSLAMLSFCNDGADCPNITTHGYDFENGVSPLHWNVTGGNITFLAVEMFVYFGLTLLVEWLLTFPSLLSWLHALGTDTGKFDLESPEDEDVREERRRVAAGGADCEVIKIDGLRKVYPLAGKGAAGPSKDPFKVAVQSLSFGIPRGECFGFLGINGAGKTTTLSILSGEFPPTSGTAFIDGFDIKTEQTKIRRKIGYCPQFEALLELLTVREHLELYARIKGIQGDLLETVVVNKMNQLDLNDFEHKAAGSLSGGNKRKLSVAIALIAEPSIVFLDEPSTGMDPMARRFMWEVISRVSTVDAKCSVILTTHSMEEAEALCTRIGIMVNGRLRCLGSGQHLRNRFGSGYEIDIKTHPAPPATLQALAQHLIDQGAIRFASLSPIMDMSIHMRASETSLHNQELAESAAVEPLENAVSAGGEEPQKKPPSQNDAYLEELMKIRISGPLHTLCAVIGKPNRAASIAPGSDGQLLHDQLATDGFITLRMFLEWWVAEEYFEAIRSFLDAEFGGAPILLERSAAHSFRYRIPIGVAELPLADIFEKFENMKASLYIKDYAVGQTTLEQIFNQFASSQDNPEVEQQQLRVEQQQQQRSAQQAQK